MNDEEAEEALRSLIYTMDKLTTHIGALIDQNSALIQALADIEDQEQPTNYLDGGSLNG